MCKHHKLSIIPTEENSWEIADTYHIKCCDCQKILFANLPLNEAQNTYLFIQENFNINK